MSSPSWKKEAVKRPMLRASASQRQTDGWLCKLRGEILVPLDRVLDIRDRRVALEILGTG